MSSSSHPDHVEREMDRLIEECEDSEKRVLLKQRRNDIVPAISRLPLCVLTSRVFSLFPAHPKPKKEGDLYALVDNEDHYEPTWLLILHVCHFWREAALNFAPMWADIVFPAYDDVGMMLRRSKCAPLTIQLSIPDPWHMGEICALCTAIRDLRPHFPRVRHFSLKANAYIWEHYLLECLHRPQAPLILESLSIDTNLRLLKVPNDFSFRVADRLRRLSLSGCVLPWSPSLFSPGLKVLDVSTNLDLCRRPPLDQMLSALRDLRSLKMLSLSFRWPPSHSALEWMAPLPGEKRVKLPNLTRIELKDRTMHCVHVLNSLLLGLDARIVLTCYRGIEDDTEQSIAAIARLMTDGHRILRTQSNVTNYMIVWDASNSESAMKSLLDFSSGFKIVGSNEWLNVVETNVILAQHPSQVLTDDAWSHLMSYSLRAIHLELATSLLLGGPFDTVEDVWHTLLPSMQLIQYLNFKGRMSYSAIRTLSRLTTATIAASTLDPESSSDEDKLSSTSPILPKLGSLCFENIRFGSLSDPESLCSHLLEFIKARKAISPSLQAVTLSWIDCEIDDVASMALFSLYVGERVDGR